MIWSSGLPGAVGSLMGRLQDEFTTEARRARRNPKSCFLYSPCPPCPPWLGLFFHLLPQRFQPATEQADDGGDGPLRCRRDLGQRLALEVLEHDHLPLGVGQLGQSI